MTQILSYPVDDALIDRNIDNPVVAFARAAWRYAPEDVARVADALELRSWYSEAAGTVAGCTLDWLDWLRVIDAMASDGTLCRWACQALMTDELVKLGVTL